MTHSSFKSFRNALLALAFISAAPQALFAVPTAPVDEEISSALEGLQATCDTCCSGCNKLPFGKQTCYKGCAKLFSGCTCS